MGCSCSRPEVLAEEKMIVDSEHSIGFIKHASSEIDLYFRKYSVKSSMNQCQLQACFEELSIDSSDNTERLNVKKFINSFIKSNTVKFKKLLIYGILCGKASKEAKAELLFHLYDPECKFVISKGDLDGLIKAIFSLSLKRCMYLFSSFFTLKEHRQLVKKYIYKCQTALPYCKSEALEFILKKNDNLEYKTYLTKILSYKDGALLDTSELRVMAYNYYIKKRPQKPVNLTLRIGNKSHSREAMEKFTLDLLEKNKADQASAKKAFIKNRSSTPNSSRLNSSLSDIKPIRSAKRNKTVEVSKTSINLDSEKKKPMSIDRIALLRRINSKQYE